MLSKGTDAQQTGPIFSVHSVAFIKKKEKTVFRIENWMIRTYKAKVYSSVIVLYGLQSLRKFCLP